MPARYFGDMVVEDLNAIAQRIMAANGIRYADTYSAIVNNCTHGDGSGKYYSCDLCDSEPSVWPAGAPAGAHCGYHYTPQGYDLIVSVLAPILTEMLA